MVDVLVILILGIIAQCMCVSNHRVIHLYIDNYPCQLLFNKVKNDPKKSPPQKALIVCFEIKEKSDESLKYLELEKENTYWKTYRMQLKL